MPFVDEIFLKRAAYYITFFHVWFEGIRLLTSGNVNISMISVRLFPLAQKLVFDNIKIKFTKTNVGGS